MLVKKRFIFMMANFEDIKAEIEKALKSLAEQDGKQSIVNEIRPILYANLDRKRIDGFIEGNLSRVPEYVNRVESGYERLSSFLKKIQVERSPKEWAVLFEQMRKWAYIFFLRKNFTADTTTQEIAGECATEAAIALLGAHFPYDTEFDPWAHVIVLNTCRKYLRNATHLPAVSQQSIEDLSDTLFVLGDTPHQEQGELENIKGDLANAIAQLSDARRQVIEMLYFMGLKPNEVALKMGKSVGAIYSLLFNSLHDLRKILDKNRNKINE